MMLELWTLMLPYITMYFYGMGLYLYMVGFNSGFFEKQRYEINFWETVFYPLYAIRYLGFMIGYSVIFIIGWFMNR